MLLFKFVHNKKIIKKTTFRTVLRQSRAVFCGNLRVCGLIIKIGAFAICGPRKFADLP
jgi:hypothetical protein